MVTVNLSIDVPELESGVEFYTTVFGFTEKARPLKEMAVLDGNNVTICVHQKAAGSTPSSQTEEVRRYSRHWTPVHADFHVDDFDALLERAKERGAAVEQMFRPPGRRAVAFCSDPFGNGFCVIASSPRSA
jgi:predicted enzyme related to lactoylglutathione lyase